LPWISMISMYFRTSISTLINNEIKVQDNLPHLLAKNKEKYQVIKGKCRPHKILFFSIINACVLIIRQAFSQTNVYMILENTLYFLLLINIWF
jgi:hypothetical protein